MYVYTARHLPEENFSLIIWDNKDFDIGFALLAGETKGSFVRWLAIFYFYFFVSPESLSYRDSLVLPVIK